MKNVQMKNVQIIDGTNNCAYMIYAFTEDELTLIFPEPGQDVEFVEDAIDRIGVAEVGKALSEVWKRPVNKAELSGLHGTLFYELIGKKKYYPTKKEGEMVTGL